MALIPETGGCSDVYFDQQVVQPLPAETEPSPGAALLATEAEHEVTIAVLLKWESGVHELHVTESVLMGILEGFPYSQYTRVLQGIGLSHTSRKPEIGIVSRIDTGRASDNFVFVADDENLCLPAVNQSGVHVLEKDDVGKMFTDAGRIEMPQHIRKFAYLFYRTCLVYFCSVFQAFFDLADTGGAETLFGVFDAVKRVSYPQPVDREVSVGPEIFVAEHGVLQIAEFY